MKTLTLILAGLIISIFSFSQTPLQFKYQAVIRNANGLGLSNEAVTLKIDILNGTINGDVVFTETHNVTTSEQGLVSLTIGSLNTEGLAALNWNSGAHFIRLSVDNVEMGTSQLVSVPYAVQAKFAEVADYNGLTNKPLLFSGSYSDLTDKPVLFSGSFSDLTNKPLLFSGSYSDLTGKPSLFSGSYSDLTDKPVLFSGSFSDLTNKPLLFSGSYSDLTNKPSLFSGSYIDLMDKPLLFSGSYADLTDKPILFSGSYSSLTDKPVKISEFQLNAENNKIINVATPTNANDAATKAYVDILLEKLAALQVEVGAKDFENNNYRVVRIGSQLWMAENLRTTKYNDGTPIPSITDALQWGSTNTGAYCWYNNDQALNGSVLGGIYNWFAVNSSKLCPTGWHVPSLAEWNVLLDELGGTPTAGAALKQAGTSNWASPNTGATNSSGFTALPGGIRSGDAAPEYSGVFSSKGNSAIFWTSTPVDAMFATHITLSANNTTVYVGNNLFKQHGVSVRCVHD